MRRGALVHTLVWGKGRGSPSHLSRLGHAAPAMRPRPDGVDDELGGEVDKVEGEDRGEEGERRRLDEGKGGRASKLLHQGARPSLATLSTRPKTGAPRPSARRGPIARG